MSQQKMRQCLVTGDVRPAHEMIRFVVDSEHRLIPDISGKLPGPGLWVGASRALVQRAAKNRLFGKRRARRASASKDGGDITVAPELDQTVEQLLAQRALNILGLARRSGTLVAGHVKIQAALKRHDVVVLVAAHDGADDGARKLRRLADGLPLVALFGRAELSLAIGRENVVHAALMASGLAVSFMAEVGRLQGFRGVADCLAAERARHV